MGYNEDYENSDFDEEQIIILQDDDGNEIQCMHMGTIDYEGQEYAALMTLTEDGTAEILIFRVEESEIEDMDDYVPVEDEDVLNAVYEIFKECYKDEMKFTD